MKQTMMLLVALYGLALGHAQTFTLKSNEVSGQFTNRQLANGFGYTGENVSPQLSWDNAPAGTQYYAITMYDKDAPTGSGFWHWVVLNIPANTHALPANAGDITKQLLPAGAVQSLTDMGKPGYVGAAPLPGAAHGYIITVYALKAKLDLDEHTPPALAGLYLNMQSTARASIIAYAQHP